MAEQSAEKDGLAMRLALAYYVPLGWALDDGEEVDPDDLAECLRAMEPAAALVRSLISEALESLDDLCRGEEHYGYSIRAHEVRDAVADLVALVALISPPGHGACGVCGAPRIARDSEGEDLECSRYPEHYAHLTPEQVNPPDQAEA